MKSWTVIQIIFGFIIIHWDFVKLKTTLWVTANLEQMSSRCCRPLAEGQTTVVTYADEIRFLRQIKMSKKHCNIIIWHIFYAWPSLWGTLLFVTRVLRSGSKWNWWQRYLLSTYLSVVWNPLLNHPIDWNSCRNFLNHSKPTFSLNFGFLIEVLSSTLIGSYRSSKHSGWWRHA